MRVLVACEFSGVVRDAFKTLGHDAWSCDLRDTEVPGPHFKQSVFEVLPLSWDLLIAFPPCTHLCVSGARWFADKKNDFKRLVYQEGESTVNAQTDAIKFFLDLATCYIPRIAVENPVGIMSKHYRKPDQIIQPWMFGHGEVKATCLWLKGLPKLIPTNIVEGREPVVHMMRPGPDRDKNRSRTYPGIASAMADQWGGRPKIDSRTALRGMTA